jgi:hypothetical protein
MTKILYLFFAIMMHVSGKASDLEVSKTHVALTTEEDKHLLRCCARVKKCWFFSPVKKAIMELPTQESSVFKAIFEAVEKTNSREEMVNSLMPIDHTELLISAIQSYGIPWKTAAIAGGLAVFAIGSVAALASVAKSNNSQQSPNEDFSPTYEDSLVKINKDFFPPFDVAVPIDGGYVVSFIEYKSNRQGETRRAGRLNNEDITELSPGQLVILNQIQETYQHTIESMSVLVNSTYPGANISIEVTSSKNIPYSKNISGTVSAVIAALTHSSAQSGTGTISASTGSFILSPSGSSTEPLTASSTPSNSPAKSLTVSLTPSRASTKSLTLSPTLTQSDTMPDFSLYYDLPCTAITARFLFECLEYRCSANATRYNNSMLEFLGLKTSADSISSYDNKGCYFPKNKIYNATEICAHNNSSLLAECSCLSLRPPYSPAGYQENPLCYPSLTKIRGLAFFPCVVNSDCASGKCHIDSGTCTCSSDAQCQAHNDRCSGDDIFIPKKCLNDLCLEGPYSGKKLCLKATNSGWNGTIFGYTTCPTRQFMRYDDFISRCQCYSEDDCYRSDECIHHPGAPGSLLTCRTSYTNRIFY